MATRSPFPTPSSVRAFAARETSSFNSAYVMARPSPGSPSKWMATRSPFPASTWRSTQLYATLSLPSLNHLANGGFDQSRVSVGSVAQVSRRACSAQKPSLSALACSYASAVTLAFAARSAGGANLRSSFSRLARLSLLTTSPFPRVSVVSQATAHQTGTPGDKGRPGIGLDLWAGSCVRAASRGHGGPHVLTDGEGARFTLAGGAGPRERAGRACGRGPAGSWEWARGLPGRAVRAGAAVQAGVSCSAVAATRSKTSPSGSSW